MSLILDALKKSESERSNAEATSPYSFDEDTRLDTSKTSKKVIFLSLAGISILAVIAGYGALNRQQIGTQHSTPAESTLVDPQEIVEFSNEQVPEVSENSLPDDPGQLSQEITEDAPTEEAVQNEVADTTTTKTKPYASNASPHEPATVADAGADAIGGIRENITKSYEPDPLDTHSMKTEETAVETSSQPIDKPLTEDEAVDQGEAVLEPSVPDTEPVTQIEPTENTQTIAPAIEPDTVIEDQQPIDAPRSRIDQGWAYLSDHAYDQAILEFTKETSRNPDSPEAYFGLGWAYEKSEQIKLAVTNYGKAIKNDPTHVNALFSRGYLRYYESQFDHADADFRTIIELEKGELHDYALLWSYMSIARSSGDTAQAHSRFSQSETHTQWPGILFSYFMGASSPDHVVAAINNASGIERKTRECVGYFFMGQQRLLVGNMRGARKFFQKTLASGMSNFRQFGAAQIELARLSEQ